MSPRRVRRFILWIVVAVIIAALVPPFINANRFRNRIAETISRSVGRPVQMGDVHFRLVPQPGFVISNLSMADDPAFSSEPVLRAESVTASLRLISLWRGRLEISSLAFDSPSLNLVRSMDGHWNVESVLRQASQVPAAPTAMRTPESRPRFPYIEATNGRINFRVGQEKRPHALMDADFALWLEAEDQWNARLEARPTRTDAYLSDTGLVRIQGSLRREAQSATKLQFDVDVEKAQLGQWTSLLSGQDRGWRGDTQLEAHVEGTLSEFAVNARVQVRDFHRHDIASSDSLDARFDCQAQVTLKALTGSKARLGCSSAGGTFLLNGEVAVQRDPDYDLQLALREVPLSSLASAYRHIKRDVPEDFTAQGTLSGDYHLLRANGRTLATGRGRVKGMSVESESRAASLAFGDFDVQFPQPKKAEATANELAVGPAGLRLGGPEPVNLAARIGSSQLNIASKGDAGLQELVAAASLFGLADARYKPAGFVSFDLNVRGVYAEFSAPVVTGNALLREMSTQVDGVAAPLHIQSASLQLTPEMLNVQKLSARLEGTNTVAEGAVYIPRSCPAGDCVTTFDLKAAQVSLDEFNRVLNPRYRNTDWLSLPLRMFGGKAVKTSRFMTLRAEGKVAVGRLILKNLVTTRATAKLSLDHGKIALIDLQGDLLSGRHRGTWTADLTGTEPEFHGKGTVDTLPLAQVNTLLRAPLGTGTARLSYELSLRGADAQSLRRSAAGWGEFHWINGSWRASGRAPALQFLDWSGKVDIAGETAEVASSRMMTRKGLYQVTGKVGFDRTLRLRLDGPRDQMIVTGTLLDATMAVQTAVTLPIAEPASNRNNASKPRE